MKLSLQDKRVKHTLLIIYYLLKLQEFKFIENIPYTLSEKGFEISMELIEQGEKVPLHEIQIFCKEMEIDNKSVLLINEVQEHGIKYMLKQINES